MRTYIWDDVPQGYGVTHYKVRLFFDGFKMHEQESVSRKPLQKLLQDWMEGKPITTTKEKIR